MKRLKNYFVICISIILIFQSLLQSKINALGYVDEFITVFLFLYYFFYILKIKKITRNEFVIIILSFLVTIIGLIGNLTYNYQTDFFPILCDIFNTFKVFIVFLCTSYFMKEGIDKKYIITILAKIIRVMILIATFCYIISWFRDIGMMNSEIRYGIKSFDFIYGSAGTFSMYLYIYLFILTLDLKYNKKSLKKNIYLILTIILCFSTLRTKAIALMIMYIFLYIKLFNNKKIEIKWYYIILGLIIAVLIGYDNIQIYYRADSKTARNSFLTNSIKIAKENFPIGDGFATYGTDMAFKYYSKVYYKYDMNNVYGLEPNNGAFAHDTYWPAILGQFGILGTILMGILIYFVYKIIFINSKSNEYNFLAGIFLIMVTAISSLSTATFFHYSTVAMFFIYPLMNEKSQKKI